MDKFFHGLTKPETFAGITVSWERNTGYLPNPNFSNISMITTGSQSAVIVLEYLQVGYLPHDGYAGGSCEI